MPPQPFIWSWESLLNSSNNMANGSKFGSHAQNQCLKDVHRKKKTRREIHQVITVALGWGLVFFILIFLSASLQLRHTVNALLISMASLVASDQSFLKQLLLYGWDIQSCVHAGSHPKGTSPDSWVSCYSLAGLIPPEIGDIDTKETLFIMLLYLPDRIKKNRNVVICNCMNGTRDHHYGGLNECPRCP